MLNHFYFNNKKKKKKRVQKDPISNFLSMAINQKSSIYQIALLNPNFILLLQSLILFAKRIKKKERKKNVGKCVNFAITNNMHL